MNEEQLKESIPSPLKLREMLEEKAVKELLGPVGGDEEEVSERIRDRYFVGILTPRKRAEESEDSQPTPTSQQEEGDDYVEGDFPPGDELAIEGVGRGNLSGDDGPTELSPLRLSHPVENSSHKGGSSQKPAEDYLHKLESLTEEQRMQPSWVPDLPSRNLAKSSSNFARAIS